MGGKPNPGTSKDKRLAGNAKAKPKGTPTGFKPFTKK